MGILKYLPKHGSGKHSETYETTTGAQAKVDTHAALKTSVHAFDADGQLSAMTPSTKSQLYLSRDGTYKSTVSTGAFATQSFGVNCYYDGTNWNRFNIGAPAYRFVVAYTGFIYRYGASAGANPISSWNLMSAVIISDDVGKFAGLLYADAGEKQANKNAASGYAGLDAAALVALAQIPATLTGKDADTLDTKHAADFDANLAAHAAATTAIHGVGASPVASEAKITDHNVLSSGVHGVGASTVATIANIATHAALSASVHGVSASGFEDKANKDAASGYAALDAAGSVLGKLALYLTRQAAPFDRIYIIERTSDEPAFALDRVAANTYLPFVYTAGALDAIQIASKKNVANGFAGLEANAKLAAARFNSFTSAQQTITAAGALTLAHGLGIAPTLFQLSLVCQTAEGGYSIGDEVFVDIKGTGTPRGLAVWVDATNIYLRMANAASFYNINNKTTGDNVIITNAYWKFILRAWVM